MQVKTTEIHVHTTVNYGKHPEDYEVVDYVVEVWWPGSKMADMREIALTPDGLKKALVDIAEGIAGE